MNDLYDDIERFMRGYVETYSEFGQGPATISRMDAYYAPDLAFPDDGVTSRDQWYERCLRHASVQDKLNLEHLVIDDRRHEVSAQLKTQAIDRETGSILLELRMHVFYKLRISPDRDIKITQVRVYLETAPEKISRLIQIYRIAAEKGDSQASSRE